MKTRILSLTLALVLCLGLAAPAFAAQEDPFPAIQTMPRFSDVARGGTPGGPWYDWDSIRVCVETGLMKGSDGAFRPGSSITVAEVAVIAARMYAQVNGEEIPQGSNWYDGHIRLLKSNLQAFCDLYNESWQPLVDEGSFTEAEVADLMLTPETQCPALFKDPLTPATREDFVYLINQGVDLGTPINDISRLPDTRDPVVLSFYNAGILTGTDTYYGNFDGDKGVTRAEAAAMVARIARPALRVEQSFLVPKAERGALQSDWQQAHPTGFSDAMMTLALTVNRYTGLTKTDEKEWFCLDFGVSSDSVLLYVDGHGSLSASYLLPFFAHVIGKNLVQVQTEKGYSEDAFWTASFTPAGTEKPMDADAYMKENLKRVLALLLLRAEGNENPGAAEIAALQTTFEASPDFQNLSARALYELAAYNADYLPILYTAEEWTALMGE